jgi:hypothetical protein
VIARALVVMCALAVPALAEPVPPHVDLAIVGGEASADVVAERVTSWFRGSPTALWVTHQEALDPSAVLEPSGHLGVQVWIVLTDLPRAQVFFAVQAQERKAPRYLVTDLTLDDGLDELGIEQLAQVVYPSALALWAGNLESPRSEVERELHQPIVRERAVTPRPDASRRSAAIGAEYAALYGGGGLAQTLGGNASLLVRSPTSAVGARVHLAAMLPRAEAASGVMLDLSGTVAAVGATAEWKVSKRVWIPAEIGLGAQIVHYRAAMLSDPTLVATGGGVDTQPIVYARYAVRIDLGGVGVDIAALFDIHLTRTHYDISVDGNRFAALVPWLVQPGLAAGVTW